MTIGENRGNGLISEALRFEKIEYFDARDSGT